MRRIGTLRKQRVHILIDSGSTYNFLHPSLAKHTKEIKDISTSLKIYAADGSFMESKGKINDVILRIHQYQYKEKIFLLPVMGCEIILGAEWLESIGPIL